MVMLLHYICIIALYYANVIVKLHEHNYVMQT